VDYRHEQWEVDVTVAGSQKGLCFPGLSFNAISEKALSASKAAKLSRSYWDWKEMLAPNRTGFFRYTSHESHLWLREALTMLQEEGLSMCLIGIIVTRSDAVACKRGARSCLRRTSRIFKFTYAPLYLRP